MHRLMVVDGMKMDPGARAYIGCVLHHVEACCFYVSMGRKIDLITRKCARGGGDRGWMSRAGGWGCSCSGFKRDRRVCLHFFELLLLSWREATGLSEKQECLVQTALEWCKFHAHGAQPQNVVVGDKKTRGWGGGWVGRKKHSSLYCNQYRRR